MKPNKNVVTQMAPKKKLLKTLITQRLINLLCWLQTWMETGGETEPGSYLSYLATPYSKPGIQLQHSLQPEAPMAVTLYLKGCT